MHRKFNPYSKWFGEWAGHGVSRTDVEVFTRLVIRPRLADQAVEFVVESMDAQSSKLVHGVVATMGVGPDGELRMAVLSTVHGAMVMPVTPDDPGALAIEGTSVGGNRVVVSLVEEDDGLMLTSYWKKNEPKAEQVGFSNVKLKRVTPA